MKFKFLCISLLVVVFSIPVICFPESKKPDPKIWKSFEDNWYYNKINITKSSNIRDVWIYHDMNSNEKKIYYLTGKYKNLDHDLGIWQFDCKNKLIIKKMVIDYDNKGNILDRSIYKHKNKERGWGSIGEKPESIITLYQKVCVNQDKTSKKK